MAEEHELAIWQLSELIGPLNGRWQSVYSRHQPFR